MAAPVNVDVNSLVYAFLLKYCPKSASLFSKSVKVNALPPGSPILEDILQKAFTNAPRAAENKGLLNAKKQDGDSSDSSDSSSESEKEVLKSVGAKSPVSLQKTPMPLQKSPIVPKKQNASGSEDSSSDSSDSEESQTANNQSSKMKKKVTVPLSQQVLAHSVTQRKKSSDSSDSEDEPATEKKVPTQLKVLGKASAKSSDSSSEDDDDDDKISKQFLNKSVGQKSLLSKGSVPMQMIPKQASSSSDDSESEEDNKGGNMAKLGKSSTPNSNVRESPKLQKSVVGLDSSEKGSKVNNWNASISKYAAEFSNDSSSESEAEKGMMVSLNKKTSTPLNTPSLASAKSKSAAAVSNIKSTPKYSPILKKASESSDDSSSESDSGTLQKKKAVTPSTQTPKRVGAASNKTTGVELTPMQQRRTHDVSSSEDSSDSEDKGKASLPAVKPSANLKPTEKQHAKSSSDSGDSSDSDDPKSSQANVKFTPMGKGTINTSFSNKGMGAATPSKSLTQPNIKHSVLQKNQTNESSDSSSETENEQKKIVARPISSIKQSKSFNEQNLKQSLQRNQADDSSESSSESEDDLKANNSVAQKTVNEKTSNLKKKTNKDANSSSSESDSEPEKTTNSTIAKSAFTPQKSITPAVKKFTAKNLKAQTSIQKQSINNKNVEDDSSSSDSEDETPKSSNISQNQSKSPVVHSGIGATPVNKQSNTKQIGSRKIETRDSESSSSSDSDDEVMKVTSKQTPKSAPSLKSIANSGKNVSKKDSSSDSSSESEEDKPTNQSIRPAEKTRQSSLNQINKIKVNVGQKESDQSSSDSDEQTNKAAKPVTPSKTLSQKSMTVTKSKKDSSDSSSESEVDLKVTQTLKKAQNSVVSNTPKRNTTLQNTVKSVEKSSSDSSSSEDEAGPPPSKKLHTSVQLKQSPKLQKESLKTAAQMQYTKGNSKSTPETDSTSDSSDECNSKTKTEVSKTSCLVAAVSKKNNSPKATNVLSQNSRQTNQKESSSSSDSSDSENSSKIKTGMTNALNSIIAAKKNTVSPKATGVKLQNSRQINKKESSSSSDSSDDDESSSKIKTVMTNALNSITDVKKKNAISKAAEVKLQSSVSTKQKESSSSDSSDAESNSNTKAVVNNSANLTAAATKSSTQVKRKKSSSSSDSSSDENHSFTKIVVKKNSANSIPATNKNSTQMKRKKSSSSDSDSDDSQTVPSLHTDNSNLQQVQKRGKFASDANVSSASLNGTFKEPNPVSDSTRKPRGSSPFRRIKSENYEIDPRLQQSSFKAKHELPNLGSARGKQFRHEKTKKKKGNHSFGKIDTCAVKSILFD